MREAVVYRTLTRAGKLVNEEWFHFAYQPGDTWFVQRLIPDSANTNRLVPRNANIVGASKTSFWDLGEKSMDVVDKAQASGSLPEKFGAPYRSLLFGTMSLQLPIPIEWHGLQFTTAQGTAGRMTLADGRPSEAEWKVSWPPGTKATWDADWTRYDYEGSPDGLPRSFTASSGPATFRFAFLSLTLGSDPRVGTNGYIPAMFSPALKEYVEFWTNGEGYFLTGGRIQPAKLPPGARVYGGERRVWPLVVLIGIAIITAPCMIFLAVRNKHST